MRERLRAFATTGGRGFDRLRRIAPSVLLATTAGALAKISPLLAAAALSRWGDDASASAFYLTLAYAQALVFCCNFGGAHTALAELVRRQGEVVDVHLPVRLLLDVQRTAFPLVAVIGAALFSLRGFDVADAPRLAAAIVTAYGMAYNQIKISYFFGVRRDRRMAGNTLGVSLCAYAPVAIAAATGRAEWASGLLAAGFVLPLVVDLVRCWRAREQSPRAPLRDYTRGGGMIVLANGVLSLATLLVVHRVETTLTAAAVIAFGAVQQLRSVLLFVPAQAGPLLVRATAARARKGKTERLAMVAFASALGAALLTAAPVLALVFEPRLIAWVFSTRVPVDAAFIAGLSAACVAAMTTALCRVLEGRQAYREIVLANVIFTVVFVAAAYLAPASHFWVQAALLAGTGAQLVYLGWDVVRPSRARAGEKFGGNAESAGLASASPTSPA